MCEGFEVLDEVEWNDKVLDGFKKGTVWVLVERERELGCVVLGEGRIVWVRRETVLGFRGEGRLGESRPTKLAKQLGWCVGETAWILTIIDSELTEEDLEPPEGWLGTGSNDSISTDGRVIRNRLKNDSLGTRSDSSFFHVRPTQDREANDSIRTS
ncbi:hypothetical protein RJT34_20545 [Clitoria ternatea]|uniref:Uncharacterized protein n=1 Tax=Clitoria ternatea TaxID=43366 RepID=A0AAN9ITA9_CLITE